MITVAGTCNSVVSLEISATAMSAAGAALTCTVPRPASMPAPSGHSPATPGQRRGFVVMQHQAGAARRVVAAEAITLTEPRTIQERVIHHAHVKHRRGLSGGQQDGHGHRQLLRATEVRLIETSLLCAMVVVSRPCPASTPSPSVALVGSDSRSGKRAMTLNGLLNPTCSCPSSALITTWTLVAGSQTAPVQTPLLKAPGVGEHQDADRTGAGGARERDVSDEVAHDVVERIPRAAP